MHCPLFEFCERVDQHLKSRNKDLPPFLDRYIEMIANDPTLLSLAHACMTANGPHCHLHLRSEYGYDPSLEALLKQIAP